MAQVSMQIPPSAPQTGIDTQTIGLFEPLPLQEQLHSLASSDGDLSFDINPHLNFTRPHSLPLRDSIDANFDLPGMAPNLSPMPQQNSQPNMLSEYPDINVFFDFELFDPKGLEVDFTWAGPSTKTTFYPRSNFPDLTTSIMTISEQFQSPLETFTQSVCILPGNLNGLYTPNRHHPESMRMIRCQNIHVQVYYFILHRLINDHMAISVLEDPKTAVDELFKVGLDLLLGSQIQRLNKIFDSIPRHFTKALEQALFCAAIMLGAAKGLAELLARGIDPNERYSFGYSSHCFPLEMTCLKGYVQATKILLDHGANPNEDCHLRILPTVCNFGDETPECESATMDMLRLLVSRGAVLKARDVESMFTSCTCTVRRFLVEELLESICEIVIDKTYLLRVVLGPRQPNDLLSIMIAGVKEYCLELGRGQHNELWIEFMRVAAKCGRHDVVANLIEEGTVPDIECFVNAARSKNMTTFLLLLNYGLDPNAFSEGTTAFAICIAGGFVQAVEELLNQGYLAQVVERKLSFEAALIVSCESGNTGMLRLLLQDASPRWLESYGAAAITAATEAAHPAVIEELLHCSSVKPDEKSLLAAVRSRNPALAASFTQRMTLIPSGDLYNTILIESILHGYDQLAIYMLQYVEPYLGVATIDCTPDREENVTKLLRFIAAQPNDKMIPPYEKLILTPLSAAIVAGRRDITQLLTPSIVQTQWCKYNMTTPIEHFHRSVFLTPLAACAYRNDAEQLQALLIRGADSEDEVAVFAAAISGNPRLLDVLLDGYGLQHPNRSMAVATKALLWSIKAGALDMLSTLLKVVNPHERSETFPGSPDWECPLREAVHQHCDHGNTSQALQIMLPYVSDLDLIICEYPWSTETPLTYASTRQSLKTVQLLVEVGGAHVSLVPRWGCNRTPLQAAAEAGSLEIVHYLLVQGAQVDEAPAAHAGATALQLAAMGGFIEIAVVLLGQGAKINASPAMFEGRTAFEGATEHGRIDMMTFLLENGADLLADDKKQFQRAIKFAEKNARYAAVEHAETLLELAQKKKQEQ